MQGLALNSGSSTLKFARFTAVASGVQSTGTEKLSGSGPRAIERLAARLDELKCDPDFVVHRIVHGGAALRQHCLIDADVLEQLIGASNLAPLHLHAALAVINFAQKRFASVPHIACLDTTFHVHLPPRARTLAVPKNLRNAGFERYGFHGLACASIVRQLGNALPTRLVIAHLGSGASVTAVQAGKSIDTSMGLTPSGGCIMATRSGDLDPGVLIHLLRTQGLNANDLESVVNQQSGLLGISGLSGDMQKLHQHSAGNSDASLAIEMFCYSVQKQIAAIACALGGVDLLVFSGGIGEHDAIVRTRICTGLAWLGDFAVQVLPAQEELEMAHIGFALLRHDRA
jgi:acetate kinase